MTLNNIKANVLHLNLDKQKEGNYNSSKYQ